MHGSDIQCEGCGKPGTSMCQACRDACVCDGCAAMRIAEVQQLRRDVKNRDAALARRDSDYDALANEVVRLRGLLRVARSELAVAASYVEEPGISIGLRTHARACAKALAAIDAAGVGGEK